AERPGPSRKEAEAGCAGGISLQSRPHAVPGSYQQRIESRLAEVAVGRQRVTKPQQAHDPKAETIREGPVLIVMLQKEPSRLCKAVQIHPLYSAGCGGEHRFEESLGQVPMTAG